LNALYCSADGRIFDPLGGIEDLKARRIRFIGDASARIREDYLRILRFLRFQGAFGRGAIDRPGLSAIIRARHGLKQLSRERIWSEFSKILELENAGVIIALMFEHGLLVDVLHGVPNLRRLENLIWNEKHVGAAADAIRRLGALGIFIEDDAGRFGQRFRLSRNQTKRLHIIGRIRPLAISEMDDQYLKRWIYRAGCRSVEDHILIAFPQAVPRDKVERLRGMIDLARDWSRPVFPIRGVDVLEQGIEPGPDVGRCLIELEDWWLKADFKPDRAALLARARRLIMQSGS